MKRELPTADIVVVVPATTSHEKTKLSKITKVTKQSEADSGNSTVKPEMEDLEEVGIEVLASPQGTSSQSASAGSADQTDGSLIDQMRELLSKNAESMDHKAVNG